jgi:hypothetical protein
VAVAAAVLFSIFGVCAWQIADLHTEMKHIKEMLMQTMVTTWRDAKGRSHTVSTPRLEGETAAQQAARHAEAVAALEAQFPPVQ